MRRIVCVIILCAFFCSAHAQRYLPRQCGIQVTAGMADGFHWAKKMDFAYYFGLAAATYTKKGNRWVVGAEYFHKKYPYKKTKIPVDQFTAEGGYYLKFLSDKKKIVSLAVGLSGLLGYEISNRGEKLLYNGATLTNKDAFIYGGAVTLEMEIFFCDKLVFLINVRERGLFGSTIGKFHTQFGAGFKVFVN